jgi:hypothetical protein
VNNRVLPVTATVSPVGELGAQELLGGGAGGADAGGVGVDGAVGLAPASSPPAHAVASSPISRKGCAAVNLVQRNAAASPDGNVEIRIRGQA